MHLRRVNGEIPTVLSIAWRKQQPDLIIVEHLPGHPRYLPLDEELQCKGLDTRGSCFAGVHPAGHGGTMFPPGANDEYFEFGFSLAGAR